MENALRAEVILSNSQAALVKEYNLKPLIIGAIQKMISDDIEKSFEGEVGPVPPVGLFDEKGKERKWKTL